MKIRQKQFKNTAIFSLYVSRVDSCGNETLKPGERVCCSCNNKGKDIYSVSYEEIVASLKKWIGVDFAEECKKYDMLSGVEIKILDTYEGSIEILIQTMINVFQFFGGLKDTYECFELFKELLGRFVSRKLKEEYGTGFIVAARWIAGGGRCDFNKSGIVVVDETPSPGQKTGGRDAFFYYLLITNIGLIATVAALVYKAVAQMYWVG